MEAKTTRRRTGAGRAIEAMAWAALVGAAPGVAAANCTGISAGDFTFYSCSDGTNFTEQQIGDYSFVSGDVSGWGMNLGGYRYIDVRRTDAPAYRAPVYGAPVYGTGGAAGGTGRAPAWWDVGGTEE